MFGKTILMAAAAATLFAVQPQPVQAQSVSDRCEDYAYRVAWRRGNSNRVGEGAAAGAVAGGVLGAIIGKGKGKNIVGGAIAGTAAGALLGAGSSDRGYINRRAYRKAYNKCMQQNRPVEVDYDSDVEYCISKYRSYNPRTGYYRTYSGELRACP
jgi:uncharacterized protein YcfJ